MSVVSVIIKMNHINYLPGSVSYVILYVFIFILGHHSAFAYDPFTHRELTRQAIASSVIGTDVGFLGRLGLASHESFPVYGGESPTKLTGYSSSPSGAAEYGAEFEDNVFDTVAFYHFFDPQNNGRSLTLFGNSVGAPSPDWVLEDRGVFPNQHYSYPKAHRQLYKAFASSLETQRIDAFGRVFQSLGHMVHHLQDMAQPQHVRNEAHLDKYVPMRAAAYEAIAKQRLTEAKIRELLHTRSYTIPVFPNARDYWQSSLGSFVGVADFTSRNFVTYKGGYRYNRKTGAVDVTGDYLQPSGFNFSDGSTKTFSVETIDIPIRSGGVITAKVGFIKGEIYDGYNYPLYLSTKAQYLGAAGLLGLFNRDGNFYFNWDNDRVRETGWSFLVPRAVAFSAGLINHFFRGSVELEYVDGDAWRIRNVSPDQASGVYRIFSENSVGVRSIVREFQAVLAKNAEMNVRFLPPAESRKLVIVFDGKLGAEEGNVHGRVIVLPKHKTSTNLVALNSIITKGSSVALTATVSGVSPSGAVQFKRDGVFIGKPVDLVDGQAKYSEIGGAPGVFAYSAEYVGDFQNLVSNASVNVTVREPILPCKPASTYTSNSGNVFYATNKWDLGSEAGVVKVVMEPAGYSQEWVLKDAMNRKIYASGVITSRVEKVINYDPVNFGGRILTVESSGTPVPLSGGESVFPYTVSCPGGGGSYMPLRDVQFFVKYRTCTAQWFVSVDGAPEKAVDTTIKLSSGMNHQLTNWRWTGGLNGCGGSSQTSPGALYYRDKAGEHFLKSGYDSGRAVFFVE